MAKKQKKPGEEIPDSENELEVSASEVEIATEESKEESVSPISEKKKEEKPVFGSPRFEKINNLNQK